MISLEADPCRNREDEAGEQEVGQDHPDAESGETVTGTVIEVVKGGLIVDIGLRGFLPASLVEMRRVREMEGLTQEAWGERIHYSAQHVSAVERGTRPVTLDYLTAVDKEFRTSFATYYREVVENELTPVWLREWNGLQDEALALRWYEPAFVPGPLQTEAYARATLRASGLFSDDEVEQRVATRMARRSAILGEDGTGGDQRLIAILDEAVLRRTVNGDRALMAEQVAHGASRRAASPTWMRHR